MIFGIALLLAVLIPLAASAIGMVRARRFPTTPATVGSRAAATRPPTQLRDPLGAGLTTGVILGLLISVASPSFDTPIGPFIPPAVLVLAPLAVYVSSRRRIRYALGMAIGAGLVTMAAPLAFVTLFGAAGLIAGWF